MTRQPPPIMSSMRDFHIHKKIGKIGFIRSSIQDERIICLLLTNCCIFSRRWCIQYSILSDPKIRWQRIRIEAGKKWIDDYVHFANFIG